MIRTDREGTSAFDLTKMVWGRGSLVVTALPLVNCGSNWTWVRTPAIPQVDLAFHRSGVDKIRTSPVLGIARRETEEERLVPTAAARQSFCNAPPCNRNAPPIHNSCIPKFPVYPPPSGERPGDVPQYERSPRNSTAQSPHAPMIGEQRESAL